VTDLRPDLPHSALTIPASDPADLIKAILAQPAFSNIHASTQLQSLWKRTAEWILQAFEKLFNNSAANGLNDTILGNLVSALLLILFFASIGFLIYRLTKSGHINESIVSAQQECSDRYCSSEALLLEANEAAASGRFAPGATLLFQAAIAVLDEKKLVRYDAARTAWEYERVLGGSQFRAEDAFHVLVRTFIAAAYSSTEIGRHDYEQSERAFMALKAAVA